MKNYTLNKGYTAAFLTIGLLSLSASIGTAVHFKSDKSSKEYLLAHGFSEPEITGFKWTCAKNTLRTFEFKAVDKQGDQVEGYVCATRLFLSDNITIEKTIPTQSKVTKPKM